MAPKATDEESPIYDYCMVLAEQIERRADKAQSAELAFPKWGKVSAKPTDEDAPLLIITFAYKHSATAILSRARIGK